MPELAQGFRQGLNQALLRNGLVEKCLGSNVVGLIDGVIIDQGGDYDNPRVGVFFQ